MASQRTSSLPGPVEMSHEGKEAIHVDELNLTTFVEAIRPALLNHTQKEDAAVFFLNSVSEPKLAVEKRPGRDYKLPDGSPINSVLRGDVPIPASIRIATTKPKVVEGAADYFRKEVMEDIHPQLQDEVTDRLLKLIQLDATIPEVRKERLVELSKGEDYGSFLSETFVYAVNRPVKPASENMDQKISIPLLVFLFLFGVAIYGMTMYTLIRMGQISQPLMAFAFFFSIGLFVFLIGFYFFLWRRDI